MNGFTHYIEFKILENDRRIYNLIFQKLHNVFSEEICNNGSNHCAISMPQYNKEKMHFGNIIRIFASSEEKLNSLNLKERFKNLFDFVIISSISPIPTNKNFKYARYKKLGSRAINGIAKRYMKHHNVSEEEAKQIINRKWFDTPFAWLTSNSSGNRYPLIIAKTYLNNEESTELYGMTKSNNYGLVACVPEW